MVKTKFEIGDLIYVSPTLYSLTEKDENNICIILDFVIHPYEHYVLTNLFQNDRLFKFTRTKEFIEKYYDRYNQP